MTITNTNRDNSLDILRIVAFDGYNDALSRAFG